MIEIDSLLVEAGTSGMNKMCLTFGALHLSIYFLDHMDHMSRFNNKNEQRISFEGEVMTSRLE